MLLQRDPPVDWKSVLLDFIRWGWTLKGVATAINVPPSTLWGWWNGDRPEPRFDDGRALLKLHALEKEKRNRDPRTLDQAVQPAR